MNAGMTFEVGLHLTPSPIVTPAFIAGVQCDASPLPGLAGQHKKGPHPEDAAFVFVAVASDQGAKVTVPAL